MDYIRLENISKKIKHKEVLKNINYCFEVNKVYGIRGENGSGKNHAFACNLRTDEHLWQG